MSAHVLQRLYLVVPSQHGWAVNLGSETLAVYPYLAQARTDAMARAARDMADGTCAGFMEPDLADRLSPPGHC